MLSEEPVLYIRAIVTYAVAVYEGLEVRLTSKCIVRKFNKCSSF